MFVATEIAHILSMAAAEGDTPIELSLGILILLQTPDKKKRPCVKQRPIISLSAIRKILATCLINRVGDKIIHNTPTSQAAYQHNRSTTERAFAFKILADRVITTVNRTKYILLMDISKVFDIVNRDTLVEDLRMIMDPDELHMIKVLLEGVQLCVRRRRETGEKFTTNTGMPQGTV